MFMDMNLPRNQHVKVVPEMHYVYQVVNDGQYLRPAEPNVEREKVNSNLVPFNQFSNMIKYAF